MDQHILSLLEDLQQLKLDSAELGFWNINWNAGVFLAQLVSLHQPQIIVEVGTSSGFSAVCMANAAAAYGGRLITIESSPKRQPYAEQTILRSKLQNIQLIKGHAPEVFGELPDGIDMVFLDATKKQYEECYKALEPNMSQQCLILADNIVSHPDPVAGYLEMVREAKNTTSVLVPIDQGMEMTLRQV
jgi:predicted O-methyltransferase YrrM